MPRIEAPAPRPYNRPAALSSVSLRGVPADYHPLAQAIFQNQSFLRASLSRLYPETQGRLPQNISVNYHQGKGKHLFEARCSFGGGEERSLLFIATNHRNLMHLTGSYREACRKDTEHRFTYRWGEGTEIDCQDHRYQVMALNFLPGITLNTATETLEQIVGVPGYPYSRGRDRNLAAIPADKLTPLLGQLVEQGILSEAERAEILRAKADQNTQVFSAFDQKLRGLMLQIDREAVKVQIEFWAKSGLVQHDPRRNNIIFQVDDSGTRTYKLIDFESLYQGNLYDFIQAFDIFSEMVVSDGPFRVVSASVRPWVWTYQEDAKTRFDRSGFFEVIWNALPQEERASGFTRALLEAKGKKDHRVAARLHHFLVEKGILANNTSIVSSAV